MRGRMKNGSEQRGRGLPVATTPTAAAGTTEFTVWGRGRGWGTMGVIVLSHETLKLIIGGNVMDQHG